MQRHHVNERDKVKTLIRCCESFLVLVNSAVHQHLESYTLPSSITSEADAQHVYQIGQQTTELLDGITTFLKGQSPFPRSLSEYIISHIPRYRHLTSLRCACIQRLTNWRGALQLPYYRLTFMGGKAYFQPYATTQVHLIASNSLFRLPPRLCGQSNTEEHEVLRLKGELLRWVLDHLSNRGETKVFLSFDASILAFGYRCLCAHEKVYEVPVTRRSLFRSYEAAEYFRLFCIIDESVLSAKTWDEFVGRYKRKLARMISEERNTKIKTVSQKVYQLLKVVPAERLLLIDTGMQGTFSLFAAASLEYWGKRNGRQQQADILLVSVYPWLRAVFRSRILTEDSRVSLLIEKSAVNDETRNLYFRDRVPNKIHQHATQEKEVITHALSH